MAGIINAEYGGAFSRRSALLWLLSANGLMFVLLRGVAAYAALSGDMSLTDAAIGAFSLPPSAAGVLSAPWTVVTYMISQFDPSHLLFNMLWLAWFGMFMQFACGNTTLLATYLAGGAGGAAAFMAWTALSGGASGSAGLMGASAAVMSVAVAITVIDPDRPVWIFFFGNVRLKWVAAAMIIISMLCFTGYHAGTDAAHAGGALAGVLCGLVRRRALHATVPAARCEGVPEAAADLTGDLSDTELLDTLLDKIRRSGYDSLSEPERSTLYMLSKRLKK